MRHVLIGLVHVYRACLSPFLPPSCRFNPTCSEYAIRSLQAHGVFDGSVKAMKRILRCHPFGGHGYDPVD